MEHLERRRPPPPIEGRGGDGGLLGGATLPGAGGGVGAVRVKRRSAIWVRRLQRAG